MKTRLSSAFAASTTRLAVAMARDVLGALRASKAVGLIIIVGEDEEHAELAAEFGARLIVERDRVGLDSAIERGLIEAAQCGADLAVCVPGDVPLISGAEVDYLLWLVRRRMRQDGPGTVGLLSDRAGTGTNIVILDPNQPLRFGFGDGSYARHLAAASQEGRSVVELWSDCSDLDIDDAGDVAALLRKIGEVGEQAASNTRAAARDVCLDGVMDHVSEDLEVAGVIRESLAGNRLSDAEIWVLAARASLSQLRETACRIRDASFGGVVTYSPKVFVPLTRLCRNVCHYCTFATTPTHVDAPYMSVDEALAVARSGAARGCTEALFTLGDFPEHRYAKAREALARMGFQSTVEYAAFVAERVRVETGLLPHLNVGLLTKEQLARLRDVGPSIGLMLENVSPRLCEAGNAHYGSPDKEPVARLEMLAEAGRQSIPVTTGLLIGIGETRAERLQSLLEIRRLHEAHRHVQEVIVQNFVPKPGTKMRDAPRALVEDLAWTIALARVVLGDDVSIQAPPNLNAGALRYLLDSGINDWGGVSPVTQDFVNPESPWPTIDSLASETAKAGFALQPRLTIYPRYARDLKRWVGESVRADVLRLSDGQGFAREDGWFSGVSPIPPPRSAPPLDCTQRTSSKIERVLSQFASDGAHELDLEEMALLFTARGADFDAVCATANNVRANVSGDIVSYVVNRNINYTNICTYKCGFCAFSKGPKGSAHSERAYLKSVDEVVALASEAWAHGATEVCLQGGIHPSFTGETYLSICRALRRALPCLHIHAFSPLEVTHGASTLGLSIREFLLALREAGLNSLPGTAAEILDDDVREQICPDKLSVGEWVDVIETAHECGLKTTATIMFGHVEGYDHWARHLSIIRDIQKRTRGFTEFVPLPFVAGEAPMYRRGKCRRGPTFRESVLMHAVSRLALHPFIPNIQTSWVKMGLKGAAVCLGAGANDIGGTLMNESITRAAGAQHGQMVSAPDLVRIVESIGRRAGQRDTLYRPSLQVELRGA